MQTHATLNDPAQTRLPLSTADLAQLRFAYSPIWELILSIRLLQSPERHALYTGWLQCTLPKLADLDLRLLTSLIRPSGYFPDFLTPPPASSHPSFAGELAQLAKTPPEQIQQQVQHAIGEQAPDSVQARYLRQPAASLRQLVDLLERYWQRALAEHWPGLQRVLEGDVLAAIAWRWAARHKCFRSCIQAYVLIRTTWCSASAPARAKSRSANGGWY